MDYNNNFIENMLKVKIGVYYIIPLYSMHSFI